uniref:Uncharacterized protein n=1 Tax=Rhizophora mucronata TaxID=61149 RepID=A0A2P2LY08_RHIMU
MILETSDVYLMCIFSISLQTDLPRQCKTVGRKMHICDMDADSPLH